MPDPTTPILGLTQPVVGASNNSWGTELNGDLTILDSLGILPVSNQNSNFTANPSIYPAILYRVTTGALGVTATLPSAASTAGKILMFKKVDSALGALVISGATIDGQTSYIRSEQYSYVWLYSNGTTYDVINNS